MQEWRSENFVGQGWPEDFICTMISTTGPCSILDITINSLSNGPSRSHQHFWPFVDEVQLKRGGLALKHRAPGPDPTLPFSQEAFGTHIPSGDVFGTGQAISVVAGEGQEGRKAGSNHPHGRGCSPLLCRAVRAQFCRAERSGGAPGGNRARVKPEELQEQWEKDAECRKKEEMQCTG